LARTVGGFKDRSNKSLWQPASLPPACMTLSQKTIMQAVLFIFPGAHPVGSGMRLRLSSLQRWGILPIKKPSNPQSLREGAALAVTADLTVNSVCLSRRALNSRELYQIEIDGKFSAWGRILSACLLKKSACGKNSNACRRKMSACRQQLQKS